MAPPEPVLLSVVRSYERYERGRLERVGEYEDSRKAVVRAESEAKWSGRTAGGKGKSSGGRHGRLHVRPWDAVRAGELLFHGGDLFRSLNNVNGKSGASGSPAPAGASGSSPKSSKASAPWVNYPKSGSGDGAVTFKPGGYTPGPAALPASLALQHQMLAGRQVAPGTATHTATLQHVASGAKHVVTLPADHKVTVVAKGDDTKPGKDSLPVM